MIIIVKIITIIIAIAIGILYTHHHHFYKCKFSCNVLLHSRIKRVQCPLFLSHQRLNYLLNTQLVQDIIKTCIHTEMRKKT